MVSKQLGGAAEESLSAIKLVVSFGQEEKEISKFVKLAELVKQTSKRSSILSALVFVVFRTLMFGFYIYSYWIGAKILYDKRVNPSTGKVYDVGALLATLMGIMMGLMMLLSLQPNIMAYM